MMQNRRIQLLPASALLLAFAFGLSAPQAAAEDCYEAAVQDIDFFAMIEAPLSGDSRLCVADNGLKGDLRVAGLTEGFAYTVWWVYIDQPGGCSGFFDCIGTFFLDSDPDPDGPLAVFGRMDSGVGDKNGKIKFSDRLDDMVVGSGSQVWMLMFGHGPADYTDLRQLARQLLTPEDPGAGYPHVGVDPRGYPAAVAIYEMP